MRIISLLFSIENIEVGDNVLAYNEQTGEQAYKSVVQLFRNKTKEWYHILANGEEIVCTAGHPFYVEGLGFVLAKDLKLSDKLLLSNNKPVIIEEIKVEQLEVPETTYNFEVEDFHTYYVTESKVLVHNMCRGNYTEIEGKAHGSIAHKAKINSEVELMAKSGEYSKIYLNKSLHTTGVKTGSYLHPDIIGVKNRGGYTIVEVASKSQASGGPLKALKSNIQVYKSIVGQANVKFIPWGY